MRRFISDFSKFRSYVVYSAQSDLKAEVAGSFLSWLWWILDPLLYMMVYSFIAVLIFKSPEPHFAVFVFVGLNCWQFFSKTVKASVRLVSAKKNIVTKVYIPKHMFVLEKMGEYGFKMMVSFVLTALFLAFDGISFAVAGQGDPVNIGFYILWLVPLFLLLFIVTYAVSVLIMHFGVFVEDLSNVITVVLQLGFYVSGIFYSLEGKLSGTWSWVGKLLVNCNPLALIITDMRSVIIGSGDIHYIALGVWVVLGTILALIGTKVIYTFENSYVKII